MSTTRLPDPTLPTPEDAALPAILAGPVQVAAFWVAVVLSLAYPVLLFGGLGGDELLPLLAAITVHVVALRLGRGYDPAA
jgi:hypothetical protein